MTLTELRYIVTLAQEHHFGRAAERCYVSQPTLSVAVKKLEDELGIALFERSKSTVQVTPLGEKIVAQAHRVLEQAGLIKEMATEGKDQLASPLRIGAIYTIGPYLFPHLIPELAHHAPQMPLYIEEGMTGDLRRKLRSGELDAVIVALPFNEPDVLTKAIYEEPFEVLLPAGHPWTHKTAIAKEDLLQEKLLLLGEGHCFRDQILEACPAINNQLNNPGNTLIAEGGSLETIRHMVASGLGITVLPKSAIGTGHYESGLLESRPFANSVPSRTVAIAWRASFPRPKAIDALTTAIETCQQQRIQAA
ncbi:hydrogen peroxide-inducible genes activator [Chromohalobacter canadensis]|uniref:LysR substrate-binding domain-containing protein n=1 Tax=Chromohalobacter canadensis TaxID=141389 RepID=A0A285VAY9_9GAMM|nr:hydrogen peroxide-inducible genes activator [Chromohalobacter canadensis]MCK0769310.1 LysR substrate-binding domain-containing protein [Chromohalobacter canadensis]MCT8469146.1 LysR family transcriptional regulator [Chromohalobacter canadensis]MCT8472664.1 LysR family transcriptional regulator [Chromohalobacter canadensis]MCT8500117.1 LysR family transcriptional regulator [Chromohalobacter canadensis]WQH10635.1 LysR substrate-binding domain-containing protein [Chromohalobacter canadensis]